MPRPKGITYELKKYALTLVPVADENKSKDKLEAMYKRMETSYDFETVDLVYEQKQDDTDHIHAYVIARRALYLKADKFKGWSIRVEPIFDLNGWTRYLKKHQAPLDEFAEEMPYMFIDEV